MQITFDLTGKCSPYGKACVHYDGEYRSDSPCGGCERNPKVADLRDHYKSPKELMRDIEGTPLPGVEGSVPDIVSQIIEANRQELSAWGATPSKAPQKRKKAR